MTPALPAGLRMLSSSKAHAAVFRADLSLLLWGRGFTVEEVLAFGATLRAELGGAKRTAALVWLTDLPASVPTEPVREALAKLISQSPPSFTGLTYIVESGDFGSATARSVITGLNLLAKPSLKVAVHATVRDALQSFTPALGWSEAEVAELSRGLIAARAAWAAAGGTPVNERARG